MRINPIAATHRQSMQPHQQSQLTKQSKITQFLPERVTKHPTNITPAQKQHPPRHKPLPPQHSHSPHSPTESLSSSLSAITPPVRKEQEKPQGRLNVEFYLNKTASKPGGVFLSTMHAQWKTDYQRLEKDHSFIQWLFPNSFQSRFNIHAKPLSLQEADTFKANLEMLERYVFSYTMILGFLGIRLRSKATGEVGRSRHPDYKERFHKTFLTSFHNHMRVTRILCSLTELGFGSYATQLCRFLKHEIYAPEGALRPLQRYNVYDQWKPFENAMQNQQTPNVYMLKVAKGLFKHPHAQKNEPKQEEKMQEKEQAKNEDVEKRQLKDK